MLLKNHISAKKNNISASFLLEVRQSDVSDFFFQQKGAYIPWLDVMATVHCDYYREKTARETSYVSKSPYISSCHRAAELVHKVVKVYIAISNQPVHDMKNHWTL